MKKTVLGLMLSLAMVCVIFTSGSFAAFDSTYVAPSGAKNSDYACSPPFLSLAARPNIHFVLDKTGSMKGHPYLSADATYDTGRGYWGYFKEDKYYHYNKTNTVWEENSSCTNTDQIGKYYTVSGCVSGKLLNYVSTNKMDILRKILTGGRLFGATTNVLEHDDACELSNTWCESSSVEHEATTSCRYDNSTAGKLLIKAPDPSSQVNIMSSSTSNKVTVAVTTSGTLKATFTKSAGSNFTTKFADGTAIAAGSTIFTSGFANAANNGYWELISISSTTVVVKKAQLVTGTLAVTESTARASVLISTTTVPAGTTCSLFNAKTIGEAITVDATAGTFTRPSGSFVTDGWKVGMEFDPQGYYDAGNNLPRTISAVTATTITVTDKTNLVSRASVSSLKTLTQRLTALVKVNTGGSAVKGLIHDLYVAPGNSDNKIDIELSFYDSTDAVDYTGGSTSNSTVKNQPLSNYINAINLTNAGGGTNTGPALVEAEKYFKQNGVTMASSTDVPSSGTPLLGWKDADSDPYYDPPASGAATNTNSLAAYCRKAYVILISDGEWNDGVDPVGPAYHMNRRDAGYDLRPHTASIEPAMQGQQSVTTYVVYAFGDTALGRNALIATAIFGGFDDKDKNALPFPFTSGPSSTYATTTNLKIGTTTFSDSTDVAGTRDRFLDIATNGYTFPLNQCDPGRDADADLGIAARTASWDDKCAEWDKSPGPTTEIPDQRHTGLPYNYFEATDGGALATAITAAVNDILQRTSSSTAASILGNNDNAGASLVQAIFYQEKQFDGTNKASWIGEVQSFWYYLDPKLNNITIREDTLHPLQLNLSEDKIVRFKFDKTYTKVDVFPDADGNGIIDSTTVPPTPEATVDVEEVKTLWRGGQSLWSRAASDRLIYTNNPTVTTAAGSRILFNTTNATTLQPYLDVSSASGAIPSASEVIRYARGEDGVSSSYAQRSRQINLLGTTHTWKLGDVINSTPKIASEVRLNSYNLPAPSGYADVTYDRYIKSLDYTSRGTTFVGANDGMLHAFKTGSNFIGSSTGIVAEIKNADGTAVSDLGKELWAFLPKNALPYLQYQMLPQYLHMYLNDGTPLLVDASIGMTNPNKKDGSGIASPCTLTTPGSYSQCALRTTVNSDNTLNYSTASNGGGTSWRSVLIGSMGYGGASRGSGATCTNCVKAPLASLGLSSFFALDITAPNSDAATDYPKLLWEFADPRLGFSTVPPTVLRVKDTNDSSILPRNGRWVAVLVTGPTGPNNAATLSFEGKSDMPLTIFIVDLVTGELLRTFNNLAPTHALNASFSSVHTQVASMPSNAFGGSLAGATVDVDKYDSTRSGAYSDDAVYIGYTRSDGATTPSWNKGGVLRLLTYDKYDPSNWSVSTVVDGIGPVTSAVAKLQDKSKHNLWLYFGSGRYFLKGDDPDNVQTIYGVKDPCFGSSGTTDSFSGSFGSPCTTTMSLSSSATGASGTGMVNQTNSISTVSSSATGWFIDLPGKSGSNFPKRIITDPVASTSGILTFTAFTPSTDICSYGGTTSAWSIDYATGGVPSGLKGQILIQLSTGAFQQVDAGAAFTQSLNRESVQYDGVPPKNQPAITTNANHVPSKRILHIQER